MKKFLVFLLIAIVTCEAIEELNLQARIPTDPTNPIDQIKKRLKELIINSGKKAAVQFCSKYLPQNVCQSAVDAIASVLGL